MRNMRHPKELSKEKLAKIVEAIQIEMYGDFDDDNEFVWNQDKEVSGADLVDLVSQLLNKYGLA